MELGKKIKQLRLKAGLTQEQLSEKIGIAPQSVSKWENGGAMPDITLLPILSEIFGVSIDELFDLTVEQRFNRIESRMDIEEELPQDVFWEYEEFLKARLTDEAYKTRATELIAFLYWHRMSSYAKKVQKYAKEAVRRSPGVKGCQWMLNMAEGHYAWDWNMHNHQSAIEFYGELTKKNPTLRSPYTYLLDNLIADRRADEAEKVLARMRALPDDDPMIDEVYAAHIALARFDVRSADAIIEKLLSEDPNDDRRLFEAAQFYASRCEYDKAIDLYERSFEHSRRRPRYQDDLMAISHIYQIKGDYRKAAETYGRIVDLLKNEWGMTEDVELAFAISEQARLAAMAEK